MTEVSYDQSGNRVDESSVSTPSGAKTRGVTISERRPANKEEGESHWSPPALMSVPRPAWAPPDAKVAFEHLDSLAEQYRDSVQKYERQGEKILSQDLSTASLPNPLKRRQAQLRIIREDIAYHEAAVPVVEAIGRVPPQMLLDAQAVVESTVNEIKRGLIELGWPEHFITTSMFKFGLNDRYRDATSAAGAVSAQVAVFREHIKYFKDRVSSSRQAAEQAEQDIRKELQAAAK